MKHLQAENQTLSSLEKPTLLIDEGNRIKRREKKCFIYRKT